MSCLLFLYFEISPRKRAVTEQTATALFVITVTIQFLEMREMRLRYQFVVREVDGTPVAVAVGRDNEKFNGMIKLNTTGGVIFKMLSEGNPTQQELLHQPAIEIINSWLERLKRYNLDIHICGDRNSYSKTDHACYFFSCFSDNSEDMDKILSCDLRNGNNRKRKLRSKRLRMIQSRLEKSCLITLTQFYIFLKERYLVGTNICFFCKQFGI